MNIENILLIATGTITTLVAGVYFSKTLQPTQSANEESQNRFFFVISALPVILLPLASYLSINEGSARFVFLLAASAAYIIGVFGITLVSRKRERFRTPRHVIRAGAAALTTILFFTACLSVFKLETNTGACLPIEETICSYASVNGLTMYYEIHGRGEPLVLLHGEFATGGMFYQILPGLAKHRQVIIIEQQGHGHTADINRPLSFSQMADDTAALLQQIGIQQADFFGYSGGGSVALQLAIRHPGMVQKIALASAVYDTNGYYPGILDGLKNPSPDSFPPIVRETYLRVAPNPDGWKTLVEKTAAMAAQPDILTAEQLQSIKAPTLVIIGDHDIIMPDYASRMAGLLHTDLVTLPGDHASYVVGQSQPLLAKLHAFFDVSVSAAQQGGWLGE